MEILKLENVSYRYKDAPKDKYVFNYENEFYKKLALYILIVCAIIGSGIYIFVKFIRKRKISNKI